jgi:Flp pilus assembly protein TadG
MFSKARKPRGGAVAVEFAFMIPLVILIILGIFEYGRLILVQQLAENAARSGARFAVVNTSDVNLVADTQTVVNNAMCGMQTQLAGYTVTVTAYSAAGVNLGTAAANQAFGQPIGVKITGTYNTAPGSILGLAPTINISTTSIMCSEAN